MQPIMSDEELQSFLKGHTGKKVIVFKHSTTCPISRAAYGEVERFEANHSVPIGMIRVIEERTISLGFADQMGVPHASPQAIVLQDGQPVWHASHYAITEDALASATEESHRT